MRLSRLDLKILFETLILKEGQVEDLLAKEPDLQAAINLGIKNPGQLRWLVRMKKFEPISDTAGLIRAFEQNKQRLEIKDLDVYRNPNDLRSALEALGESEGEQRRQLKKSETDIVYEDETWLVVMPHTMESSIQWGKGTTWCTAATQSANLFYNYVGRKDEDIVLYYIIRKGADSKLDPNAKLSIGFIDGTPVLYGVRGGLTVNASNKGLTEEYLKTVLSSKFEPVMSTIKLHSNKLKGKHPAKKTVQKIALSKDPSVLEKYTMGMKDGERLDFIKILLDYDLSAEMLSYLSRDKDKEVRERAAQNPKTPIEILKLLVGDEDQWVRNSAIKNPNIPIEILVNFAKDENEVIRAGAAQNPNTPVEILTLLASDKSSDVRKHVGKNPNTPIEILTRLANDGYEHITAAVAKNPNTSIELLFSIVKDAYQWLRGEIARNPNTPIEILTLLASDEDERVREDAFQNPTYQKYLESQNQLNERWLRLAGLTKRKLA